MFLQQIFALVVYNHILFCVDSNFQTSQRKEKLMNINVENVLKFENEYLYTKTAKFKLKNIHYNLLLRQYFVLHPNMRIYVNGIVLNEVLSELPIFYLGVSKSHNQTSLVGRLSEQYFNGTIYHGQQISFFNCQKDLSPSNKANPQLANYLCVIYHDEEIEKVIDELRSKKSQCASQDAKHVHMQTRATAYNMNFIRPQSSRRTKRNTNSITCVLHILADHKFYKHVGGESIANTVGEMVTSVMVADVTFRGTDFNGNGPGDNIGFVVGDITIYTSANEPSNRFSADNIDVYNYLEILSEYDFRNYCLAIGFTYRDFERGIVGLAWVASSSYYGSYGGICQGRVSSAYNQYKSYNTAIVTYLNYETFIPTQKSALTLTHELGHSFGSSHDNEEDPNCSPTGIYGSYIMDAYSNSGEKPNHRKFSQCSINSMYPVIVNKGTCFRRYTGPICGNSVVEGTEECDCGTPGTCSYTDPCCTPSIPQGSLDPPCTIRRSEGKSCSPVSSPCCDQSCQLISLSTNHICRRPTECSMASYCSGNSSACPISQYFPDGTLCNTGRKTCRNGECLDSICKTNDLEECQCLSEPDNLCKICCKHKNDTNCECLPAALFGILHINGDIVYRNRGEACNNFKGFCDKNRCLSDDEENVYSRMKEIFGEQNIQDIAYWFKNFWYYVIMVLFLLVLMGGIYKVTSMKIKNIDIDVEAWRYGKLMSICRGAENQIRCFQETMDTLVDRFDGKISDVKLDMEYKNPLMAISRLQLLFPDAQFENISDIVHSSSNEAFAVKMLLIKGFNMKKYTLKIKPETNISRSHLTFKPSFIK